MKTVLVVEDEFPLLQMIKDELIKQGFNALTAENGSDGLKLALEKKPDLVVVDVIMPKMDGIAMLKEMRKDPRGKDIPVVVLTNLNDPKAMSIAVENKAFDYLLKTDIDAVQLMNKIKAKLK